MSIPEWVRKPTLKSPELDLLLASSYELGKTWNPITGCLNGCPYCYARRLANGRLKARYLANTNFPDMESLNSQCLTSDVMDGFSDPFYPRFWPERLKKDLGTRPSGIFLCDMSDLFGIGIPEDWTAQILGKLTAVNYTDHRFYLLTKQPQNLAKFSPFPDNCWVGVTATTTRHYIDANSYLADIEAKVKYISIEPMLERIECFRLPPLLHSGIKWVIIGAQTKPYKPPTIVWMKEIVKATDKAGVKVFLKNNLEPLLRGNTLDVLRGLIETPRGENGKYTWKPRQEIPI